MRRRWLIIAASALVAGCGSSTNGDSSSSVVNAAAEASSSSAPDSALPTEVETTPTLVVTDETMAGNALGTPDAVSAALGAADLPCPLVPFVKDPSPIGPDVEVDEYTCVLGYEKLTIGFYESAAARASGLDEVLGYFGPLMKNFGLTEVSYAWSDAGTWTATVEPATDGFTPDIEIPATEAELLQLVADALGGAVHVIEL